MHIPVRYRSRLKWLLPGLGVKRWLLVMAVGVALVGLGIGVLLLQLRPLIAISLGLSPWVQVLLLSLSGGGLVAFGLARLNRSLLAPFAQGDVSEVAETLYRYRLRERGLPAGKLHLIPNGANVTLFRYQPQERARLRAELGLEGKFIAIYAGIHGIAQGLETLVEAARRLQAHPDIHFLLVGDGPEKAAIADLARRHNLPNFTLLPAQPRERIPAYLSAADLALVPLRNVELFKGALPSKIFDAWACERPVLLSVDGEARRILETVGGGLFVPPEDPEAIAQALLALQADPARRAAMGRRGREFTVEHYSRRAQAERLSTLLSEILPTS